MILKCLGKEKKQRYQSAGDVQTELENIGKVIPTTEKATPKKKPVTSKEIIIKFDLKKFFIPALVFIVFLTVVGYFLFRSGPKLVDIKIGRTQQITHAPGIEIDPAISPDGKMMAYATGTESQMHLYIRQIAGGRTIDLTESFLGNHRWPQWSPDGTSIAFQSDKGIYVVPALGGIPKQLVETSPEGSVMTPSWSPDGKQLVFMSDKTGRQELFVFSRSKEDDDWGVPKQLTFDGGEYPSWSPDGSLIAYISDASLRVIPPEGGDPRILVSSHDPATFSVPLFPEWSADDQTIYYKGYNTEGVSSFWSVPAGGGKTKLLVQFDDPRRKSIRREFAADGSRLFFTFTDNKSDIWVMDLIIEEK